MRFGFQAIKGFSRAQAQYEARLPEESPLLTGTIETYLTEGLFDGIEVAIEYELRDELQIFEVTEIETGAQIDPNEVTGRDRERISESILENYEWER